MVNSAMAQKRARGALVASVYVILLILTGCVGAMDNQVALSWDERWTSSVRMTVSEYELSLVGGEEVLDAQVAQALQEKEDLANTLGIHLSHSKQSGSDGSVIYIFDARGEGFDKLNWFVFDGTAQIQKTKTSEESHFQFSYTPMFSGARSYSLTLTMRGGQIIATNADRVSGNTLAWADLMQSGLAQAEIVLPVAHPALEHRLILFKDEHWKAQIRLIVAASEYAAIGDEAVVDDQIWQIQQPLLDQAGALSLSIQRDKERGSDGSVIYVVTTRGQGLDALNQFLFHDGAQIKAITDADEPYIHFEYAPTGQSAYGYSLQVQGDKIIASNANEVERGAAIWRDLSEGAMVQADITVASVNPSVADHVTLLGGERWEAETWWIVTAEDYAAMGDEEVDRLVQSLQQPMLDRAQGSEVRVEQRKERGADGSLVYVVSVQSKGLDRLNQIVFQSMAQVEKVTGPSQSYIHFTYSPGERARSGYSLQLRGQRLIASNADETQEEVAIWEKLAEADTAQADITEPGGIGELTIALVTGLVILAAAGGFVLFRFRRRS